MLTRARSLIFEKQQSNEKVSILRRGNLKKQHSSKKVSILKEKKFEKQHGAI
jgi:hypothetical protein